MITQLPIVCTDRMIPLQIECSKNSDYLWFANFDDRPGKLFEELEHIRATIVFLKKIGKETGKQVFSTKYNRWYSDTRDTLFPLLVYSDITEVNENGIIPKLGDEIGNKIYQKIQSNSCLELKLSAKNKNSVYFHNSPQYWVRAMDKIPYFWNERDGEKKSTQIKDIYLSDYLDSQFIVAVLNSALFYWWFIVRSDCRHLNMREINKFPVPFDLISSKDKKSVENLVKNLMRDYSENSKRVEAYYQTTGKVVYDKFYPSISKDKIDEIDIFIRDFYEFDSVELDYLINYDIKYRMGDELFDNNEGGDN